MARLLLFDIDMTLIRGQDGAHGPGRVALDLAFERVFGIHEASRNVSFDGRTDRGIFTEMLYLHGVAGEDPESGFVAIANAYLAALAETTVSHPNYVLPGVPALLAALRTTHPAVGLATGNIRRGAELKLSPHGLWEAFATGGFGDDTDVRSELVADGLANLAAHLGIAPEPADCVIIGDTPLDIAAAHAVGARALAVATGRYNTGELLDAGAQWAVEDLADTAEIVALLSGA